MLRTSRGRCSRRSRRCGRAKSAPDSTRLDTYGAFAEQVKETKRKLLEFLIARQARGQVGRRLRRAGQGQHAAELLRHPDRLRRLHRRPQPVQARASSCPAPTSRFFRPERIRETRPDYVLILPWNLKDEIIAQLAYVREWGGQFVVPIPEVQVCP